MSDTTINQYLSHLGMDDKQQKIYLMLYQYGAQPASTIARLCQTERVYTYKILQWFVSQWLASETVQHGVKHFFVASTDVLGQYIIKHQTRRKTLYDEFAYIKTQLDSLSQSHLNQTPALSLFEGTLKMKLIFEDMMQEIITQKLLTLTFFGTNTFQEQLASDKQIDYYIAPFVDFITQSNIRVHTVIAQWGLILEKLESYADLTSLIHLPAGNSAVNIWIIWDIVYVIIYKDHPIGIKLHSPELARSLSFVFHASVKEQISW